VALAVIAAMARTSILVFVRDGSADEPRRAGRWRYFGLPRQSLISNSGAWRR
jgi:hypothetical protein